VGLLERLLFALHLPVVVQQVGLVGAAAAVAGIEAAWLVPVLDHHGVLLVVASTLRAHPAGGSVTRYGPLDGSLGVDHFVPMERAVPVTIRSAASRSVPSGIPSLQVSDSAAVSRVVTLRGTVRAGIGTPPYPGL
jgi:hypothetical protein